MQDAAEWIELIVDALDRHIVSVAELGTCETVAICGSSRFVELAAVAAWELEKRGILALSMNLLPHWYGAAEHHQAEAEGVADVLDTLHLRKIDMADAVFIVNPSGYIGERTSVEIAYAETHSKPVHYLETPGTPGTEES